MSDIPLGPSIKVDDISIGEEAKIQLLPGKHIVTIESPYHQPFFQEIEIKKGISSKLHNSLEPLFALIDISAKDKKGNALKAAIFVDGKRTEFVTPSRVKVASGKRKIELQTKDNLFATVLRTIEPDTVYNLNFVLSSARRSVVKQKPRTRTIKNCPT